jgi:hypothetical protein
VAAEIFVRLVDEAVDVWRPVPAELVSGDVYRISDQLVDEPVEGWEFAPGSTVVCERIETSGGSVIAAVRLAPMPD